jgi:hypothetical protein
MTIFLLQQHDDVDLNSFFLNPLILTNLSYNLNCWYKINGKAIVYNTPYSFTYSPRPLFPQNPPFKKFKSSLFVTLWKFSWNNWKEQSKEWN